MEKKESKITPANPEPDTTQTEKEQKPYHHNQTDVASFARKHSRTEIPHHDNVANLNQQYPPILQWPYTPQSVIEHSSPTILKNSINAQQNPGQNRRNILVFNQQLQQHQQKNTINPVQSQNTPFWIPRPEIPTYQPFTHLGTNDSSWQPPTVVGASSSNELVSTFCNQGSYSYPMGFPGHWDASSWWGKTQTQFPYPYPPFAGGYSFFSAPPPMADGSASVHLQQRGIIRPPQKLSQKHRRLWEAQSAENVHLWVTLNRLEAEMAAYQRKLMRLESELSSLKPQIDATMEGSSGTAANLAIQTSKRGRPKRPTIFASPNDSQPRSRGKKAALTKVQAETKGLGSEKENLNQLGSEKVNLNQFENKTKACDPVDNIEAPSSNPKQTDGRISTFFGNTSSFELNGSNLKLSSDIQTTTTFQNESQQENPGNQISGFVSKPSLEIQGSAKEDYPKTAFSGNGIHGWPSNVLSEDYGRNGLGVGTHGFYDNGNMIRKGSMDIAGWNFPNGNACEEHEDDEGSGMDFRSLSSDS